MIHEDDVTLKTSNQTVDMLSLMLLSTRAVGIVPPMTWYRVEQVGGPSTPSWKCPEYGT